MKKLQEASIKIHPRAIEAMGASLVTDDNVAILELVKNAYDAFAYNVNIKIESNAIIITDDGLGMSADIIENDWATISTIYKKNNYTIERDGKYRVVSGNKGLGRLSASRLGNKLTLITKKTNSTLLKTEFIWDDFYQQVSMENCKFAIYEIDNDIDIQICGTKLIIEDLQSKWDKQKIEDLKIELQRLLNPFKKSDFKITFNDDTQPLTIWNYNDNTEIIEINKLIEDPPYKIYGEVDENQNIHYTFEYIENYLSDDERKNHKINGTIEWDEIKAKCEDEKSEILPYYDDCTCGSFTFEIRVWELPNDYLKYIANKYGLKKNIIVRKIISNQKGLSVYRDNVLVLPKSENSRDWLGLDKRRISQIGRRLSTTQIIGQINISLENNPKLIDTSSREAFVKNEEYDNFYAICMDGIISKLQQLRVNYKPVSITHPKVRDYFKDASPAELKDAVAEAVKNNKTPKDIQKVVEKYSDSLEKNLAALKERVEYYAQLASAGTFSKIIIHEIQNCTNPILRFNKNVHDTYTPMDERLERDYNYSNDGCNRLVDLSKAFSPLSRVTFKKEKHSCNLYNEINKTAILLEDSIKLNNIKLINNVSSSLYVKLHSGEMQTILINLVDNATYWISQNKSEDTKIIQIDAKEIEDNFIEIKISDTGVGVDETLGNRIFEPGVSLRVSGFGMGLVVVNEIVSKYAGYLKNVQPGEIANGATFVFTVPKESQ